MPIYNLNYYRVEPIMKIDNNHNFVQKEEKGKLLVKTNTGYSRNNKQNKSFAEILNEYLTEKK